MKLRYCLNPLPARKEARMQKQKLHMLKHFEDCYKDYICKYE